MCRVPRFCAALGVALLSAPVAASPDDSFSAVSRPALRIFRDRDGLPENAPIALTRDPGGVLWIGTEDGLASYDGRAFTTFDAPKREVSNYFRDVYVDGAGDVWCGLEDGGLARLSRGAWSTVTGEGAPAGRINSIVEGVGPSTSGGARRALWVASEHGLARKDADTWTTFGVADGLPSERVGHLVDGHDDRGASVLYVGTANGLGVFTEHGLAKVSGLPSDLVTAIYETSGDAARELWVAFHQHGVARRANGQWTFFGKDDGLTVDNRVRSIRETTAPDGARTIWVAADDGLFRFDGRRFAHVLEGALPSPTIWSLLADPPVGPTQTLWIGVDGGLARLRFGGFATPPGEAAERSTYAILVTREPAGESLWVGTRGAGLARFDGRSWTREGEAVGLSGATVYGLTELDEGDGTKSLWVGTQTGILARRARGAWSVERSELATIRRLHTFRGDDGAEVLDVATGGQGILRRVHGAWTTIDSRAGLPADDVFDVAETRASPNGPSVLWVASDGAGIARREADGSWTRFDRARGSVLSDSVLALRVVRDASGKDVALWAGTQGGGVSALDLRTPGAVFHTITQTSDPALPNDTVYEVQDDGHGRVYLFTNKGVARLTPRVPGASDPRQFTVRTFTTEDGLPSSECNGGAAFVDERGRVWAGTVSGVAYFDPAAEVPEDALPAIKLSSRLARSGAPLLAGAALSHDQSGVSFDYVLPRLFRGADTAYRTQLVGLEPTPGPWTLDARREYPALPDGAYTLRVWARDFEGREAAPASLAFRVRPPPWLTWWAFTLYAAALAGAAWALARYRGYALERRNAQLETGIAVRTEALGKKVEELAVSEARARSAEEDARRADRAKSLFLSTMSHELRTPLNAILGFAQLLVRDRALSRAHHDDVEVIQRSGEHLLGLINDVLSIAKIEAGMVVLEDRAFRLEEIVRGSVKIVAPRARAKGLRVTSEIAPDVPPAVRGDEGKLRQILLNLLGNAVKFTTRGSVTARARWKDGRAILEVEDTGPGIAPGELATLFAPFVQSASGRAAPEGTGLGLAISRSYAQRMGGDVTATSVVGEGTTFRCTVALAIAADAEAPPVERAVVGLARGSGPYRVLIVDDSSDNRRLLARLFALEGLEIREAATGEAAVREHATFAPDIVFMDVHMPGMGGVEAVRAIRAAERDGSAQGTKIVALSASVLETDRDDLLRGGCDAFVSKPYRESMLFAALEDLVGASFVRAGDSGGSRPDSDAATAERLRHIPEPLRTQLYTAARDGNLGGARSAVERLAQTDPELAESLGVLVDAFLLEEIEARMNPDAARIHPD